MRKKSECCIRLFALYRTCEVNRDDIKNKPELFSDFEYLKDKEKIIEPCLKETRITHITDYFKKAFHPQARKFLFDTGENSVVCYKLTQKIKDELQKASWQIKIPNWASEKFETVLDKNDNSKSYFKVKLNDIEAYLFPTDILIVNIEVIPVFELPDDKVTLVAKMILNSLNRAGNVLGGHKYKSTEIERYFNQPQQKKSAENRFSSNKSMALVLGLTGSEISIGDIFQSLINDKYLKSLMGDRFLGFTYIKTPWEKDVLPFSKTDYIDVVRVSRGENDRYMPDPESCAPGQNGIIKTFENVIFAVSCEGVVCWVKPKENQAFLQDQFKHRFNTIYYYLYLLSIHQRYALINMSIQLDNATPTLLMVKNYLDENKNNRILEDTKALYEMRAIVANFYLRAFFQQPASLTNQQQYYQLLQERLGIVNLLNEVQNATNELEYLISNINERKNEAFQSDQLKHMVEHSENELVLTLVVEGCAIPYYVHAFLHKALGFGNGMAMVIAFSITLMTIFYTIIKFSKSSSPDQKILHKIKKFLTNVF